MDISDFGCYLLVLIAVPIFLYISGSLHSIFPKRNMYDIKRIVLFFWIFITFFVVSKDFIKNVPKYRFVDTITSQISKKLSKLQLIDGSGIIIVSAYQVFSFNVNDEEIVFMVEAIKDDSIIITSLTGKTEKLFLDKTVSFDIISILREIKMTLMGLTESKAKIYIELGKTLDNNESIK